MRVQQSGRLGNFLFQWAFALNLAQEFDAKVCLTFDNFHSDLEILKTELKFFQTEKVKMVKSPMTGIQCKTLDFLSAKMPVLGGKVSSHLLVVHEGKVIDRKGLRLHRGYFQDIKYPESVRDQALGILHSRIEQVSLESQLRNRFPILAHPYQAIHLRLGDFKDSPFGVLDLSSRLSLIDDSMPLIVCTDGSKEEVINRLMGVDATILTPKESTAWETIGVMSKARRIITSNSTMSWWAGYIARNNQAEVFLPDTWRKIDDPSCRLQIPGSKTYKAKFD